MSANLGTLTLDLIAKIGGFTGPMDKASKQSKQFAADVDKMGKTIGVGLGVAAAAASAAFTAIVSKQMGLIDNSAKLAIQLDTTYASIANIERAGELGGIGMEKIVASSKQLSINIGKAIQGTDAQAGAFDRLGLKAQEVYDLPLDQRIATINKALLDNVTASERAAVAADLYGAKNAKAMQLLDPETIAEAARQAEIFGLNLSDVDAAKVEMAGDAMSTFSLLLDGAGKQLTVQLAPILQAVGELFLENAEEAGGMGTAIEGSVDTGVNALAFLLDAADGVKRVFTITADALVLQFALIERAVLSSVLAISMGLNKLPGVDIDISGMSDSLRTAISVANQAGESINSALEEPLAGEKFKKFVADARAAAEDAAKSTVAARELSLKAGGVFVETEEKKTNAVKQARDAIGEQIAALQFQAETIGMSDEQVTLLKLSLDGATESQLALANAALQTVSAYEAQTQAQEDAKAAQDDINKEALSIVDSLLSEEESIQKSYERRRQIILDNTAVTGEAQDELLRKLEEKRSEDLLEVNGSYWEQYLAAAEDALTSFDELAGSTVENFSTRFGSAFEAMIFDSQSLEESVSQTAEGMARSVVNALGQMAAQWLAYQVVQMLVGKTTQASAATTIAANASAMSVTAGINAFASAAAIPIVGWAAAPGAMAAALAVTAPMAVAAGSLALAGMAHEGIDSIPQTGTWLLEKGERVTTAETSAKLDKTLSDIQSGGTGAPVVNLYEDASKAGTVSNRQENGQNVIDIFVSNIMSDGKAQQAISRKFGIQGVGQ